MRATYTFKNIKKEINIWQEQREDGTVGPPYRFSVSERNCPYSAAFEVKLELEHIIPASRGNPSLAVYNVVSPDN